jgi:hypothetical protein
VRHYAHGIRHFALAHAVEAYAGTRMALSGSLNLFHAVPARSGYGISQLLCLPRPLPAVKAQKRIGRSALSVCRGSLGPGGRESAQARYAQTCRIAPQGRTAETADALSRCSGTVPCELLRPLARAAAADHASRGGGRSGSQASGHALNGGEDCQPQALSSAFEIHAPATAVPIAAAKRQPTA